MTAEAEPQPPPSVPPIASGRAGDEDVAYISDAELLSAARARISELCSRHVIIEPTLSLALRGRSAGCAYLKRNHIRLNAVLYRENFADFIGNTIPHELCHLWHYQLGLRGRPHGVEWQRLMRRMNVTPRRTHCYDTAAAMTRRLSRFAYACACRSHEISLVRHNRIMRGRVYYCRMCHAPLTMKINSEDSNG